MSTQTADPQTAHNTESVCLPVCAADTLQTPAVSGRYRRLVEVTVEEAAVQTSKRHSVPHAHARVGGCCEHEVDLLAPHCWACDDECPEFCDYGGDHDEVAR